MGTMGEADLDWSVITDAGDLTEEDITNIMEEARTNLPQLAVKNGLSSNFYSCPMNNPSHSIRPHALTEPSEVLSMINGSEDYSRVFMMYLLPSFPPQVNERNRDLLKQALSELYTQDKEKWQTVVANLLTKWKAIHHLKPEYFSRTFAKNKAPTGLSSEEQELQSAVVVHSAEKMAGPMEEFLKSTSKD